MMSTSAAEVRWSSLSGGCRVSLCRTYLFSAKSQKVVPECDCNGTGLLMFLSLVLLQDILCLLWAIVKLPRSFIGLSSFLWLPQAFKCETFIVVGNSKVGFLEYSLLKGKKSLPITI